MKLISKKKTRNNWQILRKILKHFSTKLTFLTQKEEKIIFFNSKKFYNFKNFIDFQYFSTENLTNLNFYFNLKNRPFVLKKNKIKFRIKIQKFCQSILNYWLTDFFTGGKDSFTSNSSTMHESSVMWKLKFILFSYDSISLKKYAE